MFVYIGGIGVNKNLLPIGSVVLLKGGEKRLMVTGRLASIGNSSLYEYTGCLYPEGLTKSDEIYFFNNDNVDRVYFIGFQDEEEFAYKQFIDDLGELEVVDGKVVPKEE